MIISLTTSCHEFIIVHRIYDVHKIPGRYETYARTAGECPHDSKILQ